MSNETCLSGASRVREREGGERNKDEEEDEEEHEEADDGEVAKLCLHTVYVLPEGPSWSRGTV